MFGTAVLFLEIQKHKCNKKPLHKEKLENFIVYKTMEILKNDSVIEELSALLYNLQYNESTVLPQLEQQLKEREKEIENIVNVIQQGIASQAYRKASSQSCSYHFVRNHESHMSCVR